MIAGRLSRRARRRSPSSAVVEARSEPLQAVFEFGGSYFIAFEYRSVAGEQSGGGFSEALGLLPYRYLLQFTVEH